jgi:hypothetical protein
LSLRAKLVEPKSLITPYFREAKLFEPNFHGAKLFVPIKKGKFEQIRESAPK